MAAGKRPVPFRTRKLSPPAPMVLPPGGGGRVGYRRPNNFTPTPATHQPNWCAAGDALYPAPSTGNTPPHCGLLGVQGGSAPLRTTPVTRCGHRRHLHTPHCRLPGVQDGPAPFYNTGNALRTPRLRIADNERTFTLRNADPFRGEEGTFVLLRTSSPHCGLLDCPGLRALESPITLALTIADSASLHCGQCRYLLTPQRA